MMTTSVVQNDNLLLFEMPASICQTDVDIGIKRMPGENKPIQHSFILYLSWRIWFQTRREYRK